MIFIPEYLELEIICHKFDDNSVSNYSGPSCLGHLHSRGTKFGTGKCFHDLCTCDMYLSDTLIQWKRTLFLGPETWV